MDTAGAITGGNAVELTSVIDFSATNAYAVGLSNTGTLVEHWNGTAWSPIALPSAPFTPGPGSASIAASSPSDIWVVGSDANPTTFQATAEALHFDGTAWTAVPMAQPYTNTPTISAVTALSPTNAWPSVQTSAPRPRSAAAR